MKLTTLLLPLQPSITGRLATVSGIDMVKQGVMLYFITPRGSRPLVPEFGFPELPKSKMFIPSWVQEAQDGLTLVAHLKDAQVLADYDETTERVVGRVYFTTDGDEEGDYEFSLAE